MKRPSFIVILLSLVVTSNAQWLGMKVDHVVETNKRMYNLVLANTNNDSYPDLIGLPSDFWNSAEIFTGDADEKFSHASTLIKDENYRVMVAGDIDNDGVDDLVISGYWLNGFKIFWGKADGTHTEGAHFNLTGHGKNLKLTDINLDGALDIVAFSGGSGQPITMHLFFGNKSRVLTPAGIFPSVLHTDKRVTIVDKDKNGRPDVMVASSFPWFVIFYQQADGSFVPKYWPGKIEQPFTSEYHLVDLNNDAKEDIVANYIGEGLRFYEGGTDTLFSENYKMLITDKMPYRMFFTDLNNDGFVDIVTDNQSEEYEMTDKLYFFLGNGDFTFSEPVAIQLPGVLQSMVVADFNVDHFDDIIASCRDAGIVTILNGGIATGIEDRENDVHIFPNPFSDHVQVNSPVFPAEFTVYDSKGTVLAKEILYENKTIQTGSWPAGVYIFKVNNGTAMTTRKLVLLHDLVK